MQAQRFNAQAFLEVLCFAAFGGLILYLALSGKYRLYIAPRLKPYLYFTAVTMGIWAMAGIGRLFHPQYRIHANHCFLLVIPILLFTLPHAPLQAADFLPDGPALDLSDTADESTKWNDMNTDIQSKPSEAEFSDGLPGLDRKKQSIHVSDDHFGMWFSEIYLNMEKYEGYTVTMTGFVMKDPDLVKENEFVPARLAMTCCAADLAPVGVTCRYDKASELEAGSWVTVEGILLIKYKEYDGKRYADPQIEVTKVTPAEEVEGYVYPY